MQVVLTWECKTKSRHIWVLKGANCNTRALWIELMCLCSFWNQSLSPVIRRFSAQQAGRSDQASTTPYFQKLYAWDYDEEAKPPWQALFVLSSPYARIPLNNRIRSFINDITRHSKRKENDGMALTRAMHFPLFESPMLWSFQINLFEIEGTVNLFTCQGYLIGEWWGNVSGMRRKNWMHRRQ